jgi:hypothetical protein
MWPIQRPLEIAAIPTGYVNDLALAGSHVYVLGGDQLRVIDVSDPARPSEVAVRRDATWNLSHLAVAGARLYATGTIRGQPNAQLLIFDVSDPRQPRLTATHALEGMTYTVPLTASGNTLVVASSSDLRVFDATDPSRLVQVGATARFEYLNRVRIVGDQLFIAGHFLGLWVLRLDGAQSGFGPA